MPTGLTFRLFGEDVSASDALNNFGENAKGVAKAAAAAFAGVKLADAFVENLDGEKALDKFAASIGGAGPASQKAGQVAGELYGKGFGESKDEILASVSAVGSQMVDMSTISEAELMKITRGAQAIGETFDTDVTEVARAAGQMMKSGLAPDAQTALDIIAQGMTTSANAGGDLLGIMAEYGDSFNNVGVDGGTAMAMINSAMANGAFSADIAADAVREFGTRVLDGSAEASGAFSALGLDATAMTAQIAAGGPGAKDAMGQIMTALSQVSDPLARETAGVSLFGGMWEDAGSKMILSMNPAALAVADVTGAAQTMGDTLKDNTANKVDQASRGLDSFLQSAVSLPGPLGQIVAIGAAMGPTTITMASSLFTLGQGIATTIGPALTKLKAGFIAVNAAMSANPVMAVIAVIALLVGAFIYLWNTSEGFRNFFIGVWESIKAAVGVAIEAVSTAISAALAFIGNLWRSVWGGISSFFKNIWSGITNGITATWNGISGFFTNILSGISNGIRNVWNGLVGFLGSVWRGISSTASNIWGGIQNAIINPVRNAWTWLQNTLGGIGRWFGDIFNGVLTTIGNILGGIGGVVQNAVSGIAGFFKSPINAIIDGVNWFISQINKISFSVPDWVPFIGGNSIGFNIGKIPRLAKGGIITRSTLVNAGEAGPEAIVPLDQYNGLLSQGGGGGVTVVLPPSVVMVGTAAELGKAIAAALVQARRAGLIPAGAI